MFLSFSLSLSFLSLSLSSSLSLKAMKKCPQVRIMLKSAYKVPGGRTQAGNQRKAERMGSSRMQGEVQRGERKSWGTRGGAQWGQRSLAASLCWRSCCRAPSPLRCALGLQQPLESVLLFALPPGRSLRGGGGPSHAPAHCGPEMDLSVCTGPSEQFLSLLSLLTCGHSEDGCGSGSLRGLGSWPSVHRALQRLAKR